MEITGLENKVAVVTGAGRMRSIGRPIAVELARAGCDVVLTGTGRAPVDKNTKFGIEPPGRRGSGIE